MKIITIIFALAVASSSCSIDPEPIHYGEDNCAHCNMTIMDHRYGSEIATVKGKVYKFDSVECMIEYLFDQKKKDEESALILFTPFNHPDKLVDARTGFILYSRNLPSPMGMYLSAFETEKDAKTFNDQYGGKVYSWNELLENFDSL